jgi:energy-coupling factor transport system substrate-specific component
MKATRITLLACLLTALIYAAGEALAGIPNVEVITLLVFVSGYLLGPAWGAVVGGAGMGAHSLFNALGTVAPPVWISQVACYAFVGFCGAWIGPRIARATTRTAQALVSAAAGFLLVVLYQLVVNTVGFRFFASHVPLATYVWGGLAFAAVQMVWNAALFFVALPPMLKVLGKARRELGGKAAA